MHRSVGSNKPAKLMMAMSLAACGSPATPAASAATPTSTRASEPGEPVVPSPGSPASVAAEPVVAAPSPEDLERRTRELVFRAQHGDFDGASRDFGGEMRIAMPPQSFRTMWTALEKSRGPVVDVEGIDLGRAGEYWVSIATTRFTRGRLGVKVVYDQKSEVVGLFLVQPEGAAPWKAPSYINPHAFEERPVSVGTTPALPGVLALPKSSGGPFPGVVLVHGSGPNDADEHVGGVRVFKDLAGGLASRGVAVLRYDKRTLLAPKGIVTEQQEVLDGAAAALELLRHTAGVDGHRLFVIGHSQGGYWAPRIAEEQGDVAGIVILAGPTRPIQKMLVEQFQYLASLSPGDAALAALAVDAQKFRRIVDDPALRPDQVVAVPGGAEATGAYFLFQRAYDPLATAARIRIPIQVLQGERDYQVRLTDYDAWKRALAHKPGVELHLYPALNHLLVAGTGTPSPEEYAREGHVDEALIRDVATFVTTRR